jgi:hypothetical protein
LKNRIASKRSWFLKEFEQVNQAWRNGEMKGGKKNKHPYRTGMPDGKAMVNDQRAIINDQRKELTRLQVPLN